MIEIERGTKEQQPTGAMQQRRCRRDASASGLLRLSPAATDVNARYGRHLATATAVAAGATTLRALACAGTLATWHSTPGKGFKAAESGTTQGLLPAGLCATESKVEVELGPISAEQASDVHLQQQNVWLQLACAAAWRHATEGSCAPVSVQRRGAACK